MIIMTVQEGAELKQMAASTLSVLLLLGGLMSVCTDQEPWKCSEHPTKIIPRVYLEPEHQVMEREMDQPIRIMPFYDETITTNLKTETRTRITDNIMPRLLSFLSQTLAVRPTGVPILLERECTTDSLFLTNDPPLRACADRCRGTTMCGTVQVPDNHLKACNECNGKFPNCAAKAASSAGVGVSGADFVLYVSASRCSTISSTIAFAGTCQMEASLDRPISGFINFCSDGNAKHIRKEDDDFIFTVVKHKILHAVGFSRFLYAFWRNPDGTPRTRRDPNGLPPRRDAETYQWDNNTVRTVQRRNWVTRNGVVDHTVHLMVTERVVEEARIHFGCPSLDGVELENQGGSGTVLSHWEKRIFGSEEMTGTLTFGPVFSRLTLAVLEDSGWYQVNYSMADELLWGRQAGCVFPTGSCREYILTQQARNKSITPFCNRLSVPKHHGLGCTIDRDAKSYCNLDKSENPPPEYQFFDEGPKFGGNVEIYDYCPYQRSLPHAQVCADPNNQPAGLNIPAETFSSTSRCFEHGRAWIRTNKGKQSTKAKNFGSGCYQYECSPENGVTIFIFGQPHVCQFDGQELEISMVDLHNGGTSSGSILCPSCAEICHDDLASCPPPLTGPDTNPTTTLATGISTTMSTPNPSSSQISATSTPVVNASPTSTSDIPTTTAIPNPDSSQSSAIGTPMANASPTSTSDIPTTTAIPNPDSSQSSAIGTPNANPNPTSTTGIPPTTAIPNPSSSQISAVSTPVVNASPTSTTDIPTTTAIPNPDSSQSSAIGTPTANPNPTSTTGVPTTTSTPNPSSSQISATSTPVVNASPTSTSDIPTTMATPNPDSSQSSATSTPTANPNPTSTTGVPTTTSTPNPSSSQISATSTPVVNASPTSTSDIPTTMATPNPDSSQSSATSTPTANPNPTSTTGVPTTTSTPNPSSSQISATSTPVVNASPTSTSDIPTTTAIPNPDSNQSNAIGTPMANTSPTSTSDIPTTMATPNPDSSQSSAIVTPTANPNPTSTTGVPTTTSTPNPSSSQISATSIPVVNATSTTGIPANFGTDPTSASNEGSAAPSLLVSVFLVLTVTALTLWQMMYVFLIFLLR